MKDGFYIDVGANDPWNISVTKSFYEMGWHGINIEPLKTEFEQLEIDRPRDINLNVGAGAEEGELLLSVNGGLSSVEKNIVEQAIKNGVKTTSIQITTLTNICETHCSPNQDIHFCKIDVEGFEREVLMGLDFDKFRPWIFAIEATEPCTTIPTHEKWEAILLQNNYELAYSYGVNRYYTDKKLGLNGRFIGVENLLEKYAVYLPQLRSAIVINDNSPFYSLFLVLQAIKIRLDSIIK